MLETVDAVERERERERENTLANKSVVLLSKFVKDIILYRKE